MASKTTVAVNIIGDARDLARAFGSAETSAEKFARNMDRIGQRLTVGVTLPLVAGMGAAVKAASDLNEAIDKTDAIFAESAETVKAWSETSATAMGLSSAAALDAAGSLGNMMQSQGLAAGEAAELSTNLVQLAADMGSLNNVDPTEMLIKMQAALAGEAEPLRRFGVSISAAKVEAKALEMGLGGVHGELTEGEKILARYAIIMDESALAQGNFADTADSTANALRTLRASATNAAAELGTNLLPVMERLLSGAVSLSEGFAGLNEQQQNTLLIAAGLAAASGPLMRLGALFATVGGQVTAMAAALAALDIKFRTVGVRMSHTFTFATDLALAVAGAAHRFNDLGNQIEYVIRALLRLPQSGGGSASRPLNPGVLAPDIMVPFQGILSDARAGG